MCSGSGGPDDRWGRRIGEDARRPPDIGDGHADSQRAMVVWPWTFRMGSARVGMREEGHQGPLALTHHPRGCRFPALAAASLGREREGWRSGGEEGKEHLRLRPPDPAIVDEPE